MAQTRGVNPALVDNMKKRVAAIMGPGVPPAPVPPAPVIAPKQREPVPGLMRTRNTLKSLRSSTIPKGHPRRGAR